MPARSDMVLREDLDAVCVLTLNRPERNNAWTSELEERYFELLVAAAADPTVRVIVITGAGKTFCPGADTQVLESVAGGDGFTIGKRIPQTFTRQIPKPIIAAINGGCAGVGLVQALMCDVRFMTRTAKLTTAFARRGLPAENAMAYLLTRLAGSGVAADLLLSARAITGEEAAALGVVNRALDAEELMPTALAYAADLAASCSPKSMADIKRQLYEALDLPMEQAFRDSKLAFEDSLQHPDFNEGVQSYVERRPPNFAPLSVTIDAEALRE